MACGFLAVLGLWPMVIVAQCRPYLCYRPAGADSSLAPPLWLLLLSGFCLGCFGIAPVLMIYASAFSTPVRKRRGFPHSETQLSVISVPSLSWQMIVVLTENSKQKLFLGCRVGDQHLPRNWLATVRAKGGRPLSLSKAGGLRLRPAHRCHGCVLCTIYIVYVASKEPPGRIALQDNTTHDRHLSRSPIAAVPSLSC
jgi:hypothetical protein